jgi:hypothetical protein
MFDIELHRLEVRRLVRFARGITGAGKRWRPREENLEQYRSLVLDMGASEAKRIIMAHEAITERRRLARDAQAR